MRNLLMLLAVVACTLAGHAITVQNTAGSLSSLVPDHSITQLPVTGTMDASDLQKDHVGQPARYGSGDWLCRFCRL